MNLKNNRIFRSQCPPPFGNIDPDLLPVKKDEIVQVYLELTTSCNNRCPGCLNESFISDFSLRTLKPDYHNSPLRLTEWIDILSRLPTSLRRVVLSGGEPTLHPEFEPLILNLDKRNLDFVVFSNGRWANTAKLLTSIRNLAHFKGFLISLHGANSLSHDSFTGIRGSFDQTLINIEKAANAGLKFSLSTVVINQNVEELGEITALAIQLGAEEISFNRYLASPKRLAQQAIREQTPDPSKLKHAIDVITRLQQEYSNKIVVGYGPTIPQCLETSTSEACSAGNHSLVIDPWGNIKPCLHTDLLCGNILKVDFEDILNSDNLVMWRDLGNESCISCNAYSQCGGGCRAMILAWQQSVDPLMRLPIIKRENYLSEVEFDSKDSFQY